MPASSSPSTSNLQNQKFKIKAPKTVGYHQWMEELKKRGFAVKFVTIMLEPGYPDQGITEAIEKCYSRLLTSLFRNPGKKALSELPLLALFEENSSGRQQAVGGDNWGGHYHGFLALPPEGQVRKSHGTAISSMQDFCAACCPAIRRIHIEAALDTAKIESYSRKGRMSVGSGLLGQFDILLPKSRGETFEKEEIKKLPPVARSSGAKSRQRARKVSCPECGVMKGEYCLRADGSLRTSCHVERHELAIKNNVGEI